MPYAPIALFIYNRPEHTRETLKSLRRCPEFAESPLFVFCDGPRRPEDISAVQSARAVAREFAGERVTFVESDVNKGLANSVIAGVNRLCAEYGRVIVVEDDLVVGRAFLTYLNAALDKYANEEQVLQISAHMFPVPEFSGRRESFFLPFTTSWGWATWERAWRCFDSDACGWETLNSDRTMRRRFNLDGSYDYYSMLKKQMAGRIDSWAIRWYWSVFKNEGLVLFPPQSYVKNIGFDGSGTHGWRSAKGAGISDTVLNDECTLLPSEIVVVQSRLSLVEDAVKVLNKSKMYWLKQLFKGSGVNAPADC